jgi:hypothetical protein
MMIDASDLRQEIDRVIAERFGQMDQQMDHAAG